MRETVCGISRFIKWPAGTLISGCHGADRFRDHPCEDPTPRNPSASCLLIGATDSPPASRPVAHAHVAVLRDAPGGRRAEKFAHGGRLPAGESPCANKKRVASAQ